MSLFERIKEKALERGISISELERQLGYARSSIRKWDTNIPSLDKVVAAANLLQTSVSWLATGQYDTLTKEDMEFLKKYHNLSETEKYKLNIYLEITSTNCHQYEVENISSSVDENANEYSPIIYNYRFFKPTLEPTEEDNVPYVGSVAAGTPNLYYYDSPEYISAPVSCDFAMTANGDSMYPVIHEEDYIFVKSTPFLENGDIGIISIDGETTCKKFYLRKNHIVLKSLNPNYEPMHYTIKEFSDIRIMGKVVLTQEQQERLTHLGMH